MGQGAKFTWTLTELRESGSVRCVRKRIIEWLATGFYVGKIPFMPGTFGTLWGIPVVWALAQAGPYAYMIGVIALLFFAALVAQLYEHFTSEHDPGEVIIDEVVGYAVAMTWLPLTWQAFLAGFLLFRVFDIWKPFPIRQVDRKISGGLGTVLDDVLAGLVCSIILQIIYTQTAWLGESLHG